MNSNLRKGLQYEDLARDYLIEQGLGLLQSNYRCRFGEIDLIMHDGDVICFVEVKFRRSLAFGGAAVALPQGKQRKIIKSARLYIATNTRLGNRALRFDAFLIQRQPNGANEFNWIRNAFYAE
ncbi:MAG: YraN family protein [Gammaproteobacteria bacterium]|nr:YraN family protein [Gammaproteobacteria bacterium]MDH3856590.1 YraN family protein [Gammaproteobacteria bacterium]